MSGQFIEYSNQVGDDFFYTYEFQVKVTPAGRPHFERLEEKEKTDNESRSQTPLLMEAPRMTDWKLKSIADVAPTLKDLKSLSVRQQSMLLLRRLATQFPPPASFGKMNFDIPAYASMLTQRYASNEVGRVKDLLLGDSLEST